MTLAGLPILLAPHRVVIAYMRLYTRVMRFGLRWIAGVRIDIRGREHLPEGPLIIAGTHQAMLDVFIPFFIFDDPMIVMKRELLWYPGIGWFAMRTGMLAIDRGGTSRTMKQMLAKARTGMATKHGRQIVIFPEGTRAAPGAVPDFKSAGVRAFYKALDVPILPVVTNSGLCWPARGILRNPGTVVYEILPPIEMGLPHKQMLPRLFSELEVGAQRLYEEGVAGATPIRQGEPVE